MKKMITATTAGNVVQELYLNVDLYFSYATEQEIAADKYALHTDYESDWNLFINKVIGVLRTNKFTIEQVQRSNYGSEAYYITFYPIDPDGALLTEYIVHLRLATHFVKEKKLRKQLEENKDSKINYDEEWKSGSHEYFYDLSQKYKRSKAPVQAMVLEEVVVNDIMFNNKDEALTYIDYLCKKLSEGKTEVENIKSKFIVEYRKSKDIDNKVENDNNNDTIENREDIDDETNGSNVNDK